MAGLKFWKKNNAGVFTPVAESPEKSVDQLVADPDMTPEDALAIMLGMVEHAPGLLRVVTDIHKCEGGSNPISDIQKAKCFNSRLGLQAGDPAGTSIKKTAHFSCHAVTKITGPDHRGLFKATTEERDYCIGYPIPLLRRLTQHYLGL